MSQFAKLTHLFRLDELELVVAARPRDDVPALVVLQKREEELPKLQVAPASEAAAAALSEEFILSSRGCYD